MAAVLVGGAVASLNLTDGSAQAVSAATSAGPSPADVRSPQGRADRSELREAQAASPTPTVSPTPSPTPRATKASPSPTAKKTTGTSSAGTCGVSYYEDGDTTADGESFDPNALTAASRTLPFNTRVRVTNPKNGKSVVVRINDRGPFVSSRCLDLAKGAFLEISTVSAGVIPNARYEVLK